MPSALEVRLNEVAPEAGFLWPVVYGLAKGDDEVSQVAFLAVTVREELVGGTCRLCGLRRRGGGSDLRLRWRDILPGGGIRLFRRLLGILRVGADRDRVLGLYLRRSAGDPL